LLSTPQHITVEDGGRVVAEALIRADTEHRAIQASFHVEAGHLPVGTRARLVDAVLGQPALRPGTQLQLAFPVGDGEILHRLRERCTNVQIRAAGVSCMATGTIPAL